MKRFALWSRVGSAVLTWGVLGCGGGDLTLPNSTAAGLTLTVTSGNDQAGTVGEALPQPVIVTVATEAGVPAIGRRVAFVASGSGEQGFRPDTAVTDSKGQASTLWVMGTAVGGYSAEARIVAPGDSVVPVAPISASARSGTPDTLRATGPLNQPGHREGQLADPLAVIAVDRFGNPVEGAVVQWSTNDGRLSEASTATAADGTASVTWTLGERLGIQSARATLDGAQGSPLTFTALVLF